jgi:AcrR family transcriptional regulator
MNEVTPRSKPRGRPRGFDRDKALECAMRLFWERGYEATSISDLTKAMGLKPPALYGAFGDKKHLFLEAVDRYQAGPGCFAQEALTQEPTAKQAVRRLLHDAIERFADPSGPKGCMVVLSATNCTAQADDVQAALADLRRSALDAVRNRLAAGQAAGDLTPDADIDTLASLVTTTLYGLALQARDGVASDRLHKIADQVLQAWPAS